MFSLQCTLYRHRVSNIILKKIHCTVMSWHERNNDHMTLSMFGIRYYFHINRRSFAVVRCSQFESKYNTLRIKKLCIRHIVNCQYLHVLLTQHVVNIVSSPTCHGPMQAETSPEQRDSCFRRRGRFTWMNWTTHTYGQQSDWSRECDPWQGQDPVTLSSPQVTKSLEPETEMNAHPKIIPWAEAVVA